MFSYSFFLTLSSIYTHFNTFGEKSYRQTWTKVKLLKLSNFTFSHNVFYTICILKSFNSNISVVVCSFLKFGTVSKWSIRKWVKRLTACYCLVKCQAIFLVIKLSFFYKVLYSIKNIFTLILV